jgi:hypothetical protein
MPPKSVSSKPTKFIFISTVTPLSTFSFPVSTHEHLTFNFHYGTASLNLSVAQKGGSVLKKFPSPQLEEKTAQRQANTIP